MISFDKNNSDKSENVNKSYIKRKFNGIKSVALIGAIALSLGGCLSLQEYKEYKELKEENEWYERQLPEAELESKYKAYKELKEKNEWYEWHLPEDIDAALKIIEEDYQSQLNMYEGFLDNKSSARRTDTIEFIDEYNKFCAENNFDYSGAHKKKIDDYKNTINKCIDVLENYLEAFENDNENINIESVDNNLDLAQETLGELKGYVRYVDSIKESKTTTQSEEAELELE